MKPKESGAINGGLLSGILRISSSNNFRDWFHFDAARPTKNKAIILETDFKIFQKIMDYS